MVRSGGLFMPMKCFRVFCVAMLVCLPCAGQVQWPGTPAGQQAAAWLDAFNLGDHDAYLSFLEKNMPDRTKMIDAEMGFRSGTGGFDLKKVEDASSPTKIVALMQERASDQMARLTMEVAAEEPHAITGMGMRAIQRPADFPLPHMSQAELIAAVKKDLEKESAAGHFSGTMLIASGGKPVFEQAYGVADRASKTRNTVGTQFRIGSMNK